MKKLYLQCLLNLHMEQKKKALYKHPENAVIFILLDISNCNFLIILVLSIFIEMPFFGWGLIVGLIFDFGNRW